MPKYGKNKITSTLPFKCKNSIFNLFDINRLQEAKMGVTDFLKLKKNIYKKKVI